MEDALARIGEHPKVLILRLHLVAAMDATGMNAPESVLGQSVCLENFNL